MVYQSTHAIKVDDATTVQPAPAAKRKPRLSTRVIVLLALAAGAVLSVPSGAYAMHRNGSSIPMLAGSTAADAERVCKAATEELAQHHLEDVLSQSSADNVTGTIAGVDMDRAVKVPAGWTVNGTIRYSLVSFLGQLPITLYVVCNATETSTGLVTDVAKR